MINNNEIWKVIPETEGLYEASSYGRVRRIYKNRPPKVRTLSYKPRTRYLRVALFINGRSVHKSVHRLICEAFHGPAYGREVDHLNNVRDDNRPENLEWVTRSENTLRSYQRGYRRVVTDEARDNYRKAQANRSPDTRARGEKVASAKLTEREVKEIIELLRPGSLPQREVARRTGASVIQVWQIANNRTWKHVPR